MQQQSDKGFYHRVWFFVSVSLRSTINHLFWSSLAVSLFCLLTGSKYLIVFGVISLLAGLFRLGISAYDWKNFGFIPEYDRYRLWNIENRIGVLERKTK